jgi:hypothetical protein
LDSGTLKLTSQNQGDGTQSRNPQPIRWLLDPHFLVVILGANWPISLEAASISVRARRPTQSMSAADPIQFDSRDCAMKPIEIPATRWDYYDPRTTPLSEFKLLAGALCLFSLFFSSFWWSHFYSKLQLISCFLCPAILLTLPRLTRNAFFAYQGAPIISFNEQGFWARRWSYFGWINWRNVTSVKITSDNTGLRHRIEIQLTDEEFAHLSFSDRACVMLVKGLERFLQSSDDMQNTLIITGSSELTCSGADFKTTINRVLSNAHVPCTWKQTFPAS